MAQYFRTIKGKKFDREMLDLADTSTTGKGDGRISLSDARRILKQVSDSDRYTDVEKRTMSHIRDHYKFTPEADAWFRTEVRRWAAMRKPASPRKKSAASNRPAKTRPAGMIEGTPSESAPAAASRPSPPAAKKSSLIWKLLLLALIVVFAAIALLKLPLPRRFLPDGFTVKPDKPTIPGVETTPRTEDHDRDKAAPARPEKKDVIEKQPAPQTPEGSYYTVEPKDSLVGIAEKITGDYRNWTKLFHANRGTIKHPTLIFPGQKLVIPEDLRGKRQ